MINKSQQSPEMKRSLGMFGLLIFILEIVILLFYGNFVRMQTNITDPQRNSRYASFQDINVMVLVGFGFLMSFIKTHALSSLSYTFFINAVVMQLFILFNDFWIKVFRGFGNFDYYIKVDERLLLSGSSCVASVLIGFGCFIGRVGPKQLLIAGVIQTIGFSFNQVVQLTQIHIYDAGATTTIHAFGSYFSLAVSWMLSRKIKPNKKPEASSGSHKIAMIGTFFLWMFWPSFNFGASANNIYDQNFIVANTYYSLTGSCLSTFMMSALLGSQIAMVDVLNSTLAGGVIIGISSGFLYQPAVAIAIGIVGGIVSTLGFKYLSPFLQSRFNLHDTCGNHNLHGLPAVLGGILSAIIMASYQNGFDPNVSNRLDPANNPNLTRQGSFLHQGWLQIAGTLSSVGIAIAFGLVAGYIVSRFYDENPDSFYEDDPYIKVEEQQMLSQREQKSSRNEVDYNQERLLAPS